MAQELSVAELFSVGFRKCATRSSCVTKNSRCPYRRSLFGNTWLIAKNARTRGNLAFMWLSGSAGLCPMLSKISQSQAPIQCCDSSSRQVASSGSNNLSVVRWSLAVTTAETESFFTAAKWTRMVSSLLLLSDLMNARMIDSRYSRPRCQAKTTRPRFDLVCLP